MRLRVLGLRLELLRAQRICTGRGELLIGPVRVTWRCFASARLCSTTSGAVRPLGAAATATSSQPLPEEGSKRAPLFLSLRSVRHQWHLQSSISFFVFPSFGFGLMFPRKLQFLSLRIFDLPGLDV
jgi:hypothetical protein